MNKVLVKRLKWNRGFTLVEMMITVAVLSIVMLFVSQLLNFNIRFVKQEDIKLDKIQNVRVAASHIMNTINTYDAAAIEFDASGGKSLIRAGSIVLLDATGKTANTDNNARLWFHTAGGGKGELRTGESTVLSEHLAGVTMALGPGGRYVTVNIVPEGADMDVKSLKLIIPLLDTAPLPSSQPSPSTGVTPSPMPSPTPSPTPAVSPTPSATPNDDLIGEFLFDDSSNNDTSGTNDNPDISFVNVGTAEGPAGMGEAMYFDGVTSYISVENFAVSGQLDDEITIDFWCYPEEIGRIMMLFNMVQGNGNSDNGFELFIDAAGQVVFETKSNSANILTSTYTLSPFNWYHIRATYASSGSKTLKIADANNIIRYSGSVYAGSPDIDAHDSNPLVVGVDPHNNDKHYEYYFKGRLDEIRIYRTAMP